MLHGSIWEGDFCGGEEDAGIVPLYILQFDSLIQVKRIADDHQLLVGRMQIVLEDFLKKIEDCNVMTNDKGK